MATPDPDIQAPELDGSEQHHNLKNDPGKKGNPDHTKDININDDGTKKSDTD